MISITHFSQSKAGRDQLLARLKTAKEDSNKVNILIAIGKSYEEENKTTAEKYYLLAGTLGKKIGYTNGMQDFYAFYLDLYAHQGKPESALPIAKEAVAWFRENKDSLGLAKAIMNIGTVYLQAGDYENAAANFEKGRALFAKLGNTFFEGQIYDRMQLLATDMHQYKKGVEYGLKAVRKLENQNRPQPLSYAYHNLAYNYLKLGQFPEARKNFDKALSYAVKSNEKPVELMGTLNIAYIYLLEGNLDKAKSFADKGLDLSKQFGSEEGMSHAYWGIGEIYLNKKDYKTAEKYGDSANVLIKKNNFREQKLRQLLFQSKLAYAMQNPKKGNEYSKDYEAFRDSLLNENLQKITTDFEKKYESAQKDSQIKEQAAKLKNRSLLNYIFAAMVAAILLIAFLIYRNLKHRHTIQKQKITELETEKQLAATEAVLRGEEQERSRLAKDLHDGLGGMLSGVKLSFSAMKENLIMTSENAEAFERSIHQLDNSIREMRRVAHNMLPENLLKYGLDNALREFCIELGRTTSLETSYQSIDMEHQPFSQEISVTGYRVVQELANNVLKHSGAKHLLVQAHFSDEEKMLHITVEDDGKGFEEVILSSSEGIGWKNIRNRVQFVKGKIDLNSGIGKGTSVLIEIPV